MEGVQREQLETERQVSSQGPRPVQQSASSNTSCSTRQAATQWDAASAAAAAAAPAPAAPAIAATARQSDSQTANQTFGQPAALPSPSRIVRVWIDGLCLNQGPKSSDPEPDWGCIPPRLNIAICLKRYSVCKPIIITCLRVPRSRDLRVHTYLKWSYAIALRLKQDYDRQWRPSTRQKLMSRDIWDSVCDILRPQTAYGPISMAIISVPLRPMCWPSKRRQHTLCDVYREDQERLWPPRGPEISRPKGVQTVYM